MTQKDRYSVGRARSQNGRERSHVSLIGIYKRFGVGFLFRLALWKLTALNIPLPRRLSTGGPIFWCCGDMVGQRLWLGRPYEDAARLFVADFLEPGMVVLDVGAHRGIYTLIAAKACGLEGKVFAFEPSSRERKHLLRNLQWNRCRNVEVMGEAVGAEDGMAEFFVVEGQETGGNSLRPPAPDIAQKWRAQTVRMISVDSFLAGRGIERVDFMKIDVEGGERDVLKGARTLLAKRRHVVIMLEVSDRRTEPWGYEARETVEMLLSFGFAFFEVGERKLSAHEVAASYDCVDMLAVPNEGVPDFCSRMKRRGWTSEGVGHVD